MRIKRYFDVINESNDVKLAYYAMDWDDNILSMPTIIHMDKLENNEWKPVDISTEEFAIVRKEKNWRIRNNNFSEAFAEFTDNGTRKDNAFINDLKNAVSNKKFGPSWNDFIRCLTKGRLFAIITTRSHNPQTIRKGIEWIIYNYLTPKEQDFMTRNLLEYHSIFGTDVDYVIDQYLDHCFYFGVGDPLNDYIKTKLRITDWKIPIEERKSIALSYFKKQMIKYGKKVKSDIKIGFSDDDVRIKNVMIKNMGREKELDFLHRKNPKINYYIYDTSNPKNVIRTEV